MDPVIRRVDTEDTANIKQKNSPEISFGGVFLDLVFYLKTYLKFLFCSNVCSFWTFFTLDHFKTYVLTFNQSSAAVA